MTLQVVDLAYRGEWRELLHHLTNQPHLVNSPSTKGYMPLHQAAWHGAGRQVIGVLLALGADSSARTLNRSQSAADIALEKHPTREDLHFLLHDGGRTPGQLLRKLVADEPELFKSYDGNRVLCDRVLECLYAGFVQPTQADIGQTLLNAIQAVAGVALFQAGSTVIGTWPIAMEARSSLWLDTIVPAVVQMSSRAHVTPLERLYPVMSDLFDPMPSHWGLRGDPFLWMEMRHALCHVPIPEDDETVERILLACFISLTGKELKRDESFAVARFHRGGMSSGMVCGEAWTERLLPKLRQRAQWLRDVWESER
jgi:hypothetical protein